MRLMWSVVPSFCIDEYSDFISKGSSISYQNSEVFYDPILGKLTIKKKLVVDFLILLIDNY